MTPSTRKLVAELNTLLRLTSSEALVAQARRAQAATDAVERELVAGARDAEDRAAVLRRTVIDLGGVPDVLGAALGRVSAVVQSAVAQGVPLSDALFADLSLYTALAERARYAKVLAEAGGHRPVVALADRCERDAKEGAARIRSRLAEIALGGPVALRATPTQAVAGFAQRLALFPARYVLREANRAQTSVERVRSRAGEGVSDTVDRFSQLIDAVEEIFTAGRDAALERAEDVARDDGDVDTAKAIRATRTELGALGSDELPVDGYDDLGADTAAARVKNLRTAAEVRTIERHERAHKDRKGVLAATEARLAELADGLRVEVDA